MNNEYSKSMWMYNVHLVTLNVYRSVVKLSWAHFLFFQFFVFCLFIRIRLETMWLCWILRIVSDRAQSYRKCDRCNDYIHNTRLSKVQSIKESGHRIIYGNKWIIEEYTETERITPMNLEYLWLNCIVRHKGRNALYLRHLHFSFPLQTNPFFTVIAS